ncbi:GNAT family N-acetyltransferase [Peteryoungia desertarenae]|uniref:GNAT family N-acetyltransferase n=1 Tax=Peteryoungia desertarenae TaxID=1813451 RepID=UPI001FE2EBC9|nr:GNAT family N-acetyltransferase [Peteryoungia desertarenae]
MAEALLFRIVKAKPHHFAAIQEVELAAFETLRVAGAVSGQPEASTEEELERYLEDDLLLIALSADDAVIGYAGAYGVPEEACLHLGEIDVHPDHQGQGIGRRLVSALMDEARERGMLQASLTTDRLAPFNAGFYQAMGFVMRDGADCPPRLAGLLQMESAKGLDPKRRCAMTASL